MDPPSEVGNLIITGEDTLFGLPSDPGRAISRQTVSWRKSTDRSVDRALPSVRTKACSAGDAFQQMVGRAHRGARSLHCAMSDGA